jgi:hypothetical protein
MPQQGSYVTRQNAITQDSGTQAAGTTQGLFRTFPQRPVHPVARAGFLGSEKAYPLNLKLLTNQRIQVHTTDDDVSPVHVYRLCFQAEPGTEPFVRLQREQRHLPLVIDFVVKVSVSSETSASNALNRINLLHTRYPWFTSVVTGINVLWRNENVPDLHGRPVMPGDNIF